MKKENSQQQYKWLTDNGFIEQNTVAGKSTTWMKDYGLFNLVFYWLNSNKTWSLYIENKIDEVLIAELPEDADFTKLDVLITVFNTKYK